MRKHVKVGTGTEFNFEGLQETEKKGAQGKRWPREGHT
jgi:hypothetical protein